MPQSICSLPVEVVLKILDNLIIQDDGSTASIGNGAIYTLPSNRLDKTLSPFSDEHGHVPVGDLNLLYPIKILRTTCKYLNEICESILYQELNLLADILWLTPIKGQLQALLDRHGHRVLTLRLGVDQKQRIDSGQKSALSTYWPPALSACKHLRSLSLYFWNEDINCSIFAPYIIDFLENGQLMSLGLYSRQMIEDRYLRRSSRSHWSDKDPMYIIKAIASSSKASNSLKFLDIAIETVSPATYDLIITKFPNLTSLSVRQISSSLTQYTFQQPKSSQMQNLTKLCLIGRSTMPAPTIPLIVDQCKSLQQLIIVECRLPDDVATERPRATGWSSSPDAICKRRAPLRSLHIEHVQYVDVMSLGVIPTKYLALISADIYDCMEADKEMFPGLQTLRVLLNTSLFSVQDSVLMDVENPNYTKLRSICNERQVVIQGDAQKLLDCGLDCWYCDPPN